jgi:diguanylate cyclase
MVYFHNVADEINLSTSLRLEVEEREKATKTIFKVQSELQEYSELALKDNMTGLGNFRYFETEVLKTLQSSIANNSTFSLVMIDVDKFKTFNDTYGHQQGDEVLRVIGKSISQAVRASDVVARYGGEEFVMILKNTKMTDLERICEKVRLSVQNAKVPKLGKSEEFLSVTISLGGVVIEPSVIREKGITDYKTLLEIADKNLYSAKNGGRNRTVVSLFT